MMILWKQNLMMNLIMNNKFHKEVSKDRNKELGRKEEKIGMTLQLKSQKWIMKIMNE